MHGSAEARLDRSARSVTMLLDQVNGGGEGAFGRLVEAVYDDLRRVAAKRMGREFDGPLAALTESPTALVHQALIRLREQRTRWQDGDHFFAIATRLLGYVIADYKKQRMALKRGRGRRSPGQNDLLDAQCAPEPPEPLHEGLEAAAVLQALHERHPRKAEVATLHVLAGKSMPEVARMMDISLPTAERDWRFAKAWIREHFEAGGART
jgi:RNA polymerase sigma factor (TIGR02999 family)